MLRRGEDAAPAPPARPRRPGRRPPEVEEGGTLPDGARPSVAAALRRERGLCAPEPSSPRLGSQGHPRERPRGVGCQPSWSGDVLLAALPSLPPSTSSEPDVGLGGTWALPPQTRGSHRRKEPSSHEKGPLVGEDTAPGRERPPPQSQREAAGGVPPCPAGSSPSTGDPAHPLAQEAQPGSREELLRMTPVGCV